MQKCDKLEICGACGLAESNEHLAPTKVICKEGYGIRERSDRACIKFDYGIVNRE